MRAKFDHAQLYTSQYSGSYAFVEVEGVGRLQVKCELPEHLLCQIAAFYEREALRRMGQVDQNMKLLENNG